jgi:hypothetical protein
MMDPDHGKWAQDGGVCENFLWPCKMWEGCMGITCSRIKSTKGHDFGIMKAHKMYHQVSGVS